MVLTCSKYSEETSETNDLIHPADIKFKYEGFSPSSYFPWFLDGNDVIVVILTDLVYQSPPVYATSNELQLSGSFASK